MARKDNLHRVVIDVRGGQQKYGRTREQLVI
jgi:hypothetical protein